MTTSVATETKAANSLLALKERAGIRRLLGAVPLAVLFLVLFSVVQFSTPALAGNDGYYHVKMGLVMREQGLKPDFPWLPLSILKGDAYYDHHLLYHAYLALFAATDPAADGGAALTQSGKVASILMPTFTFLAIWWLLRGQQVRWAAVWAAGLFAVSEAFLYRMSMPRAQSASLLVLVLALHWLLQGRYRRLLPLGFAYVWLYNAFPLILVVAVVYVFATWLVEREVAWRALAYPVAGIGLGLLVNPYFPENISFIVSHLLPKIGESAVRVGNEWYPYETWTLIENSGFGLALCALGMFALGWRERRMDRATLVAFLLVLLSGVMLFKSRRFVEYFPAFVLIFAALSISPLLETWREKRLGRLHLMPAVLTLLLALPVGLTVIGARDAMARSKPADQYAAASLWLKANSVEGKTIFQTDWDDFTRLFFYDSDAIYTAGLDPTYMELYDKDLYETWVDITRGRVKDPGSVIRDRFGGEYVFSDLKHDNFLDRAEADPSLTEVYRDEYAVIFTVAD